MGIAGLIIALCSGGAALIMLATRLDRREGSALSGSLAMLGVGLWLAGFMATIELPFHSMRAQAKLREIEALRAQIQRAEARDWNILDGAIALKAAELNGWLANAKYWNATVFDPYWPDAVDTTQAVR